jgi:hypothetical protein
MQCVAMNPPPPPPTHIKTPLHRSWCNQGARQLHRDIQSYTQASPTGACYKCVTYRPSSSETPSNCWAGLVNVPGIGAEIRGYHSLDYGECSPWVLQQECSPETSVQF